MCGNCLLQETAFICPMACPKGLRNGPCGGSTPDNCCVVESRPCIWYEIYHRSEIMNRLDRLLEIQPPLDWSKTGTSALHDVFEKLAKSGLIHILRAALHLSQEESKQRWNKFFHEIRQPNWWKSDLNNFTQERKLPFSNFERKLRTGKFVITCELIPPLGANFSSLDKKLHMIDTIVDAIIFYFNRLIRTKITRRSHFTNDCSGSNTD